MEWTLRYHPPAQLANLRNTTSESDCETQPIRVPVCRCGILQVLPAEPAGQHFAACRDACACNESMPPVSLIVLQAVLTQNPSTTGPPFALPPGIRGSPCRRGDSGFLADFLTSPQPRIPGILWRHFSTLAKPFGRKSGKTRGRCRMRTGSIEEPGVLR